jgi:hypothetical protein
MNAAASFAAEHIAVRRWQDRFKSFLFFFQSKPANL